MLSKKKLKTIMNISVIPIELEVLKKDGKPRTVHSFKICAEVDLEKEKEVRRRDGITCFITNEISMAKEEVVFKYRAKPKLKKLFGKMKSQLALRLSHMLCVVINTYGRFLLTNSKIFRISILIHSSINTKYPHSSHNLLNFFDFFYQIIKDNRVIHPFSLLCR